LGYDWNNFRTFSFDALMVFHRCIPYAVYNGPFVINKRSICQFRHRKKLLYSDFFVKQEIYWIWERTFWSCSWWWWKRSWSRQNVWTYWVERQNTFWISWRYKGGIRRTRRDECKVS
jgi:hypothetical protein